MSNGFSSVFPQSVVRPSPATAIRRSPRDAGVEDEVIALFDQLRVPVIRYFLFSRVPAPDAEEMVQEVFLLLFSKMRAGRVSDNPAGWVFLTAHNFLLKYREKMRRESGVVSGSADVSVVHDQSASVESVLEAAQRQDSLLSVVRALPDRDQQCLHLRAEGLKYREISLVLGISLGAVANSLRSSLARLTRASERPVRGGSDA